MSNISINDFLKLGSDIYIIDIRSVEKYNCSHIPGAINIPSNSLLSNPSQYLNKDVKYYLYCQHGITSRKVGLILSKLGFNIVSIDGGYESYILR